MHLGKGSGCGLFRTDSSTDRYGTRHDPTTELAIGQLLDLRADDGQTRLGEDGHHAEEEREHHRDGNSSRTAEARRDSIDGLEGGGDQGSDLVAEFLEAERKTVVEEDHADQRKEKAQDDDRGLIGRDLAAEQAGLLGFDRIVRLLLLSRQLGVALVFSSDNVLGNEQLLDWKVRDWVAQQHLHHQHHNHHH